MKKKYTVTWSSNGSTGGRITESMAVALEDVKWALESGFTGVSIKVTESK